MSIRTFRCGHARTPENTKTFSPSGDRCATCYQAAVYRYRAANATGNARGRPRGDIGDALPTDEAARRAEASHSSRQLLTAMMKLGIKSGGCLSISAAQCRARLQGMGL